MAEFGEGEDKAGDGGGATCGKTVKPYVSKQDSQIYEEVLKKNKEDGNPNMTLGPSNQIRVQMCW